MPQHMSVATIDSPEFINLQPLEINPLMSSCEIKVLYIGENRNKSYITKEVATEMAKTLRGAPIVGYFKENKGDFADHGEQVIIDDEGIKFKSLTRPYGFVAPNAQVWFQKFEDTDDFGNTIVREYLMTTGYLWTGQYEECQSVLTDGKPQSMELDKELVKGNWSKPYNQNVEYFIISDAVFKNLCILGEDVEPCFEGANITSPDVSTSFSKMDEGFTKTLYKMMQDLQFALEGGSQMDENKVLDQAAETVVEEPVATETDFSAPEEAKVETTVVEEPVVEPAPVEDSFAKADEKKEDEEKKDDAPADDGKESDDKKDDEPSKNSKDDEDEKKKYSLLESQYEELQTEFSALQEKYNSLLEFKEAAESKEKMELINSFYMLSEEDKKDVVENITKYSLDDIEAKLAVKCLHNGAFNLKEKNEEVEAPVTTFNLENAVSEEDNAPAWIAACRKTRDNR